MPFEIPENIHELCAPLAWMIGSWHGNGHGDYPTIEGFHFGQELVFQQDGRPFIHYFSRAWIVDGRRRSGRPRPSHTAVAAARLTSMPTRSMYANGPSG